MRFRGYNIEFEPYKIIIISVERPHKIENPKCVRSKETELGIGIFQLIS